jgi:hypothetical protein
MPYIEIMNLIKKLWSLLLTLLGDGVYGEEKIFLTGPTRATKAGKKLTSTKSPTNQPREDPFHLYSLCHHFAQFQQWAGATTP